MSNQEPSSVATRGLGPKRMMPDLKLVGDVWGGTDKMREAGKQWLPQEAGETQTQYQTRLQRSTFFNAFKRTIKNLVGKPFSKPVVLGENLSPQITGLLVDVDRSGRHFEVFAHDLFTCGLRDGLVGLLIDYPDTSAATNKAEEMAMEPRPYMIEIDARQIVAFRYHVDNGKFVLDHVRFSECVPERVDRWTEIEVEQIRVLEIGIWQLWRKQKDIPGVLAADASEEEKNKWVLFKEGTNSLTVVPFVVFYTQRTGFIEAEPPLKDLAHLNIEHWQSSSDQRHILHVARVPILIATGFPDTDADGGKKTYIVGPGAMVTSPNPEADMKYVEHTGKAIEAGATDIENIENRMAVIGTNVLIKKAGAGSGAGADGGGKSATEAALDTEAEFCDLAVMVRYLEDALEASLTLFGMYMNVPTPDDKFVTINKDFGISLRDAADFQALLGMRQAREISQLTFLKEFQRRGVLDPALDLEDEITAVRSEPPPFDAMGGPTEADSATTSVGGKGADKGAAAGE
jgi:hypothetical protein